MEIENLPLPIDHYYLTPQQLAWTPERRAAQAERCRELQPWRTSTGPKTPKGKRKSSLNSFKNGRRSRIFRELCGKLGLDRLLVLDLIEKAKTTHPAK
jgi:hypothetical protein